MKFYFGIYFILAIILLSCIIGKTKLSVDDLKWINVYSTGDSLIFRSEKGEYDTSIIIEQGTFYGEANPIETGLYQHQWGQIKYKNKKLTYDPNGREMISMIKSDPPSQTRFFFDYLYSSFSADPISGMQKYKKGNIYEFDCGTEKESYKPRIIFWDEKLGLVKYIAQDGTVWERINIPK